MTGHSYSDVGKYKRTRLIGSGQFGDVYEVHDRALQADRALKIVQVNNPSLLLKKLKEAQLLEICRHRNVVEVKEADIQKVDGKNCVIITTELLSRGSAQDLVSSSFVTLYDTIRIIRDALFGLEHLHDNDVAHCDIKPGNILLSDQCAKLSDFGLAVSIRSGQLPSNIYTLHMAPEAIKGSYGTKESDIYAMGVTMYRMVNNINDFKALAPSNVDAQIVRGRFPDRKRYRAYVPARIKRIVNKAMSIKPSSRFESAFRFGQALDRLVHNIIWKRKNQRIWIGNRNSDVYKIVVVAKTKTWIVDFKKNGRRVGKYCLSGLKNNWEAENRAEKIVADTSLE